jgi:hypothetical protein
MGSEEIDPQGGFGAINELHNYHPSPMTIFVHIFIRIITIMVTTVVQNTI